MPATESRRNNQLPELECDVLIIGSGPIGATYAREILKGWTESPSVVMVETGAQESKIPGDHKKNAVVYQKHIDSFVNIIQGSLYPSSVPTVVNPNLKLPPVSWSPRGTQNFNGQNQEQNIYRNLDSNGVSRNVGGMSTHWTCATPRQHPKERSNVLDNLDGLYERAEKLIATDTKGNVLKDSIRQRLVLKILRDQFTDRDVKPLPLAAKKVEGKNLITWSSSATILQDLLKQKKMILRQQHICEKLEFQGSRVSGAIDQGTNETADPLRIPFDDLDPQVTLPFGEGHEWHTQIHRDAFSYGAVPPAIDKRTIVDLRYFGGAEVQRQNRVKFSKTLTDAYGMPQPTFDFRLSKKDRKESHRMMEDMEKVAGVLGGYLPGSEPQFLAPGLALHVCGTTVASRRDPNLPDEEQKDKSCCDETSKVWGVDNLYLGGLNVVPGSNASNPTLTAMCFAIKGAEAIRNQLKRNNSCVEDDTSDDRSNPSEPDSDESEP
ncbi:hypothetical protein BJY04DRAFT_222501 [Aspergillus karnatakaensis]|uniref:uncharacterized protein n=1 Tax=Aspergillus karnatakaensis TaxID=1810916 RepID=UPI003CCE3B73